MPSKPIPPIHPKPGGHPADIGPELLQALLESNAPSKETLGPCRVCGRPAVGICVGKDCGLPVCVDCGLRCPHELGGTSSEIPQERIQGNALLVPAVVRRELEKLAGDLAEVAWWQDADLKECRGGAQALVSHILGVGIEHYRRLTSAGGEALSDPDLWGKSVLEDLPAGEKEREAGIRARLEERGCREHAAGWPRARFSADGDWLRGWDAAEAASKKTALKEALEPPFKK